MARHGDKGVHVQYVNIQRAAQLAALRCPFAANMCMARWEPQMRTLVSIPLNELLNRQIHGIQKSDLIETNGQRSYVIYTGSTEAAYVPLFVWDDGSELWFENADPVYGKITTRQRKRMRPQGEVHRFDTLTMRVIAVWGFRQVSKVRLERKRDWQTELRGMLDRVTSKARGY
jgi:hypothetical protein